MISKKDIDHTINTNLIGPINLTQLVSKIMVKKNSSIIDFKKGFKEGSISRLSKLCEMILLILFISQRPINNTIKANRIFPP